MDGRPVDRRDVLSRAWRWAAAALAAGSAAALVAGLKAARGPVRQVRFGDGELDRAGPAGMARDGVWAARVGAEVRALSLQCPHLGCTVAPVRDGFRCPCHGSRFDASGGLRSGPAERGLAVLRARRAGDGYEVAVEDGHDRSR